MDDTLLDRLVALLHQSGLREIEFEDGDVHIRLVKNDIGVAQPSMPAKPIASALPESSRHQDHAIVAGLTGTFYRSPSPDAPPFVEIGSRVAEGQTIGLLEAMKMLNPIEADRAGHVLAISAENGALVARGDVLFRLAPDDAS